MLSSYEGIYISNEKKEKRVKLKKTKPNPYKSIFRIKQKNSVIYSVAYNFLEKFLANVKYTNYSFRYLIQTSIRVKNDARNFIYLQYFDYRYMGDLPKRLITIVINNKKIIYEDIDFSNNWTIQKK